jgi:hypothetical protein
MAAAIAAKHASAQTGKSTPNKIMVLVVLMMRVVDGVQKQESEVWKEFKNRSQPLNEAIHGFLTIDFDGDIGDCALCTTCMVSPS